MECKKITTSISQHWSSFLVMMKKVIKYILRILGWIMASIIILLAIAGLLIQTPYVKSKVIDFAEEQVNKSLSARLEVRTLKGNFFTHLQLKDIFLISKNDTLLSVSSLNVKYQLLPLLHGKIVVNEVSLEQPHISLLQFADSSWNFQKIIKPQPPKKEKGKPFTMLIDIHHFLLDEALINIHSLNKQLPQQIAHFNIELTGSYQQNHLAVDLKKLNLKTLKPDLQIKNLSFQFAMANKIYKLTDFALQTAKNNVYADGEINLDFSKNSFFHLKTTPLNLNEFETFLPKDFQLKVKPNLQLSTQLTQKELQLLLSVKEQQQKIDLQVVSPSFASVLRSSKKMEPAYLIHLNFQQIDLRQWLTNSSLNIKLNGKIQAQGRGLNPHSMQTNLKGELTQSVINNNSRIENLNFDFNLQKGNLKGLLTGNGNFGLLSLTTSVDSVLGEYPQYQLDLLTQHLNLAMLTGQNNLNSDLSLQLLLNGAGLKPEQINANTEIRFSPSTIYGLNLQSFFSKIHFQHQNIIIDTLSVATQTAHLSLNGNYHLKKVSNLNLQCSLDSASELKKFVDFPSLETAAQLQAHLEGIPKNWLAQMKVNLFNTQFQSYRLKNLTVSAGGKIHSAQDYDVKSQIEAQGLNLNNMPLDKVNVNAELKPQNIGLEAQINGKDFSTSFHSVVQMEQAIRIGLSDWMLKYKDLQWGQGSDTAFVKLDKNEYEINHLKLFAYGNDTVPNLSINGKMQTKGTENLNVSLSNIDCQKLITLFSPELAVNGLLNVNVDLKGSATSPILNTKMNIDNFSYQNYKFNDFEATADYEKKFLTANVKMIPQDSGQLLIKGKLPMQFRLDTMQFGLLSKTTDPVDLQLSIEKFPLTVLHMFLPKAEIGGFIESNVAVNGTVSEPNLEGQLNITDGKLLWKQYGINYPTILTNLEFQNNNINLDTFLIKSQKGFMLATGNVKLIPPLNNLKINDAGMKVEFNNFEPISHKYYNMELSGNASLATNQDSSYFSGEVTIPRSEFYLPAVMRLIGQTSVPEMPKPLLVEEIEKMQPGDSMIIKLRPDTSKQVSKKSSVMLPNLQGNIRVKIPHNTWIKNDNMRLELSGDVEFMKHYNFFELFGSVEVVRGQYNLLGKVFIVESGTVTFAGGEKINPILDLKASYTFHDQARAQRKLLIQVTGETSSPEIAFTLDDELISEGDAVSYILFGTQLDAISFDQQATINEGLNSSDLAKTAIGSFVSSEITKLLGSAFNVDYVEFKSKGSLSNGSFVVGKYLTNNLFLSYERNFGNFIKEENVSEYEVKVEYELFHFLFLQLTSSPLRNGFDVVFKINSK